MRRDFVYRSHTALYAGWSAGDVHLLRPRAGMILGRLTCRNSLGGVVNVSTLWYSPDSCDDVDVATKP
jgi:hypothetical protein